MSTILLLSMCFGRGEQTNLSGSIGVLCDREMAIRYIYICSAIITNDHEDARSQCTDTPNKQC